MRKSLNYVLALAVFIAAGMSLSFASEPADVSLSTVHRLMQTMQSVAAPGWSVSYDKTSKTLDVSRNESTLISSNIPNPAPGQDDDKADHFSFFLWIKPLISKAEYAREKETNRRTQTKISEVYARLVASPTVGGIQRPHGPVVMPSEPYSSNEADQKEIAKYEHLKQSLYDLPDGHFRDISVRWTNLFPNGPLGATPTDEGVRKECEALYQKLAAIPAKY